MAVLNFNAQNVPPATGVADPIPSGWYIAAMDESELKPTKAGDGHLLLCRFNVLDGQYAGRKLFARLNIGNMNPVAVEIAYKELSAIAHATGVIQVQDSQQLHGRPLKVKVRLRAASGDYDANNEITAYRNVNDPTAVNTASTATAPPSLPPAALPPAAPTLPQAWATPQAAQPWAAPQAAPATAPQTAPAWVPPTQPQPWAAPVAAPTAPAAPAWTPPVAPQAPPAAPPAAPAWTPPANVAPAAGPQTALPPWATPAA